jgi:hypothetical protein
MSLTPYASNKTIIMSIMKYFNSNEQYSINFEYYLNFAVNTNDGILIKIKDRKFLVDYYSGSVIKEVR